VYFLFLRKIFSVIQGRLFSKTILSLILLFVGLNMNGQNLVVDSTKIVNVEVEDNTKVDHSPHKATIFSAILPGLGQAYNKKYWKVPLVYAGFGSIGYFIGWNNNHYKTMRNAYSDLTDSDSETNSYLDLEASGYYDLEDATDLSNFATALNKQQEYYRRNRDLLIICMVGFYGLNIIDASVDAHFFDFDMSEDLSMNWQPTMQLFNSKPMYGVTCSFTF